MDIFSRFLLFSFLFYFFHNYLLLHSHYSHGKNCFPCFVIFIICKIFATTLTISYFDRSKFNSKRKQTGPRIFFINIFYGYHIFNVKIQLASLIQKKIPFFLFFWLLLQFFEIEIEKKCVDAKIANAIKLILTPFGRANFLADFFLESLFNFKTRFLWNSFFSQLWKKNFLWN